MVTPLTSHHFFTLVWKCQSHHFNDICLSPLPSILPVEVLAIIAIKINLYAILSDKIMNQGDHSVIIISHWTQSCIQLQFCEAVFLEQTWRLKWTKLLQGCDEKLQQFKSSYWWPRYINVSVNSRQILTTCTCWLVDWLASDNINLNPLQASYKISNPVDMYLKAGCTSDNYFTVDNHEILLGKEHWELMIILKHCYKKRPHRSDVVLSVKGNFSFNKN